MQAIDGACEACAPACHNSSETSEEPAFWGWKTASTVEAPFEFDASVEDPFKLILLGRLEQKDLIPERLRNVVEVKAGLDYVNYYKTMHQAGLVLPAFKGDAYYSRSKRYISGK